jgi:hypothetical protein
VSHARWIASRIPAPPERIAGRVREMLAAHPPWEALPLAEALVSAAETLLDDVLAAREGGARDAALDLLAADACVTWAFEAAADAPGTLGSRAEDAMRRLAAVAR